jgi:hypothetical protein
MAWTCGVDTYRYLLHVFARIPPAITADDYAAMLPRRVDLLGRTQQPASLSTTASTGQGTRMNDRLPKGW